MTECENQTKCYRDAIEHYLDRTCFSQEDLPQKELFSAMRYSLLAGGKRLRGIFVLDFCRMCGGDWNAALPFAAALEMVHAYSLIHDDLPCMDNDDYRRGKLTNHKVYGEAMAVLAGDGLLTAAFSQLASAGFDSSCRINAVKILAECAGELGMVGGQALDIKSDQRECTAQEVLDIQARKTGALIRAAALLGVLAGDGTQAQRQAADQFAAQLGLAFQIRDDMLDVIGDAHSLGKATGVDAGKNTFVRLYGVEECGKMVKRYTAEAVACLDAFPDHAYMAQLAESLSARII